MRNRYEARPVGPRDVGEPQRSMYALRRDGIPPVMGHTPIAGFYERPWIVASNDGPRVKRWIPIRIWLSPAVDPDTQELLDRSPTWLTEIDGREGRLEFVWPECSGRPITAAAYVALLRERDAEDGFSPETDPWEI